MRGQPGARARVLNALAAGTIPPQLGALSKLTDLVLSENLLGGTLPPQLGNLTSLTYLGFACALRSLSLSCRSLPLLFSKGAWRARSSDPALQCGVLKERAQQSVCFGWSGSVYPSRRPRPESRNAATWPDSCVAGSLLACTSAQPIRFSLAGCRLLHVLRSYNKLEGSLPAELGRLTSLTFLKGDYNQLGGSLPRTLG